MPLSTAQTLSTAQPLSTALPVPARRPPVAGVPVREPGSVLGTAPYRGWPMSSDLRVDHGRMLELLGIEGQLLAAATHDAHQDLPVPGVSGRTVGETVRHAGDLCEDALSWMGSSGVAARDASFPADAGLRESTGRFTARLAELLAEFAMRPPGDSCPTWWPEDHSAGFWVRRMTHAMTVCRVDVQAAVGIEMTPIDSAVAVDGVDEVLRLWLDHRLHTLGIGPTRACSVEVRVAGRAWRVAMTTERASVERAPAPPGASASGADGCVTGDPWAVYLWLWGRLPNRSVEVVGDPDAIAQLWGLLRLATR